MKNSTPGLNFLSFCILFIFTSFFLSSCQEAMIAEKVISDYQRKQQLEQQESKPKHVEDGSYTTTSESSNTTSAFEVKNGKMEGLARQYYPGGELWKESTYKAGKLHGPARVYEKDGGLIRSVEYQEGKKQGRYIKYFKSGKPKAEMDYANDLPMPGISEIGYRGESLEQPKIQVREEDQLASEGRYYFHISLDGRKADEFYVFQDPASWKAGHPEMKTALVPVNENGEATVPLSLKKDYRFTADLHIFATYKSHHGLDAVVSLSYEADVWHL